ncbi:hypothetical protein VB774_00085 [Pseudanabaena galeata UHCC 0370]|uniref:Uncharacterized protein n=1 Tax=Pseudanabaena galeata UHCC 0370 TaxID=3110310 RepID=A0ABU5TCK1_9CYAN|nr:hypothetical protein [Pseudanabaena galeata]MEA5476006.1 hypothetical protein [Pseudanabaena galeata UHCC 0370]
MGDVRDAMGKGSSVTYTALNAPNVELQETARSVAVLGKLGS